MIQIIKPYRRTASRICLLSAQSRHSVQKLPTGASNPANNGWPVRKGRFSVFDRGATAHVQASAKGRRGRLFAAFEPPVTKGNLGDFLEGEFHWKTATHSRRGRAKARKPDFQMA